MASNYKQHMQISKQFEDSRVSFLFLTSLPSISWHDTGKILGVLRMFVIWLNFAVLQYNEVLEVKVSPDINFFLFLVVNY